MKEAHASPTNQSELLARAVAGDKQALEDLLLSVQDMIFNLSLRMLGTIPDAEDASQEILVRVMTGLSSFRGESAFSTWVFRIAANHLQNYRKNMFAQHPLSFELYGQDISCGKERDVPDLTQGVDRKLLEEELKYSCTNVMLQCFDPESRCIYILGTMFHIDSRVAGEILGMTPEAYRQRLSRIRRKMAEFLKEYCGLSGTGSCRCSRRVNYAIATHRLDPQKQEYSGLGTLAPGQLTEFKNAMEEMDGYSTFFSGLPAYRSPDKLQALLMEILNSRAAAVVCSALAEEGTE